MEEKLNNDIIITLGSAGVYITNVMTCSPLQYIKKRFLAAKKSNSQYEFDYIYVH